MYQVNRFKNVLVELVSYVGKSFPVSYIKSVSFYRNNNITATCFWGNEENEQTNAQLQKMLPGLMGPSCIIYNLVEYYNSTEVDIEGTDTNGKPFAIHGNLKFILNSIMSRA